MSPTQFYLLLNGLLWFAVAYVEYVTEARQARIHNDRPRRDILQICMVQLAVGVISLCLI